MRWHEFKIAFVLFLTLVLFAAPASAGSVERIFPSSVSSSEVFQVTVNVADYGAAGQVLEKLPEGFAYINSTLPEEAVTVNGNKVSFLLIGDTSFSYNLKAPASAGTYQFVGLLRDINKAEFPILSASNSIKVGSTSSGGSGGGSGKSSSSSSGGGGAGGSPEPQSNVEAKELSQAFVTSGTQARFDFPNGATCIRYVEFDARKTLGKLTTVVEMLKGQSRLVSSLPEGTVYKNVNIWVGSGGIANSDNIENAVIGFRVEKSWLEENGVDANSLSLWHYDKAWSELETWKAGEDETYMYFAARTPGFGSFAIVASSDSTGQESSGSIKVDPITRTDSETDMASEPEQPSGEGNSMPGFESAGALGVLGAVYLTLRRKF